MELEDLKGQLFERNLIKNMIVQEYMGEEESDSFKIIIP